MKNSIGWRCSVRNAKQNCAATVKQKGDSFTAGQINHSHPSVPGTNIAACIKSEAKVRAKIVETVMQEIGVPSLSAGSRSAINNFFRQANRVREKTRTKQPADLDFVVYLILHFIKFYKVY